VRLKERGEGVPVWLDPALQRCNAMMGAGHVPDHALTAGLHRDAGKAVGINPDHDVGPAVDERFQVGKLGLLTIT
jgi:hypothetical protein